MVEELVMVELSTSLAIKLWKLVIQFIPSVMAQKLTVVAIFWLVGER